MEAPRKSAFGTIVVLSFILATAAILLFGYIGWDPFHPSDKKAEPADVREDLAGKFRCSGCGKWKFREDLQQAKDERGVYLSEMYFCRDKACDEQRLMKGMTGLELMHYMQQKGEVQEK